MKISHIRVDSDMMATDNPKLLLVLGTAIISIVGAIVPVSSNDNLFETFGKKSPICCEGGLYPRESLTRELKSLDGIWNFRLSPPSDPLYGFLNGWYLQDLERTGPVIPMPVPSSYNDVGTDESLRDHTGVVWYDRRFYAPQSWENQQRVWLRFASVHYQAKVFLNGVQVVSHEIGHLPFQVEVTERILYNSTNLLTVAVDNTLTLSTIPQENGYDFFNYAGIHRPVILYTTPLLYIDDIIVNTDVQGYTGIITYNLTLRGSIDEEVTCQVVIFDRNKKQVSAARNCSGVMDIPQAHLWWPYLMHDDPGYLYTFTAALVNSHGELVDLYSEKIGIRTIRWTNTSVYLNDKPLYMRGFGMHEDSDFRGKGWDPVLWVKNMNLIKWVGANTFRTSHYPYAEEIYQLADEHGIMIIDECPSVNAILYSEVLLEKHKQSLTELIRRDKNHPSVIMWSIANEPVSDKANCDQYFKNVVLHVKSMDVSRPVTYALANPKDIAGKHLDVISFNRYNGWYVDPGNMENIAQRVELEARQWHQKYNRSVLMSEYGADTLPGMHYLPTFMWSEDYQVALMSEHFKAFDKLRKSGFFIGEFIWNFADFQTKQGITRAGGNKKGIFTRSRQPKASAHLLRSRYLAVAAADAGLDPPPPALYVSDNTPATHNEL
ncbi:beta-glucuronidase isoform X2 [Plodia interpunctella]|uniref:beta-glucuronidase isoform X2 n=1 Tax=Plodia interpunctella TaxID=58824 RepID=UPI00236869E2|nr:beta-glucuronidase isoform X2 [Plodia interpunctella]